MGKFKLLAGKYLQTKTGIQEEIAPPQQSCPFTELPVNEVSASIEAFTSSEESFVH
jgi:hypothetical protein